MGLSAGETLIYPWAAAAVFLAASPWVFGDETCQSPYMAKIVGQEDYVYVCALGAEALGDGQDKLVTVDANPASNDYGTVAHTVSVGGRNEAHHGGFTDDRAYFWAGGLDTGTPEDDLLWVVPGSGAPRERHRYLGLNHHQDAAYTQPPSRAVQYAYVCQASALRRKVRIAHAAAL